MFEAVELKAIFSRAHLFFVRTNRINQLVAQKTKNADVVTAALSEAVGGKPPSYEAAVLSIVLDAGDSSCPLIQVCS